MKLETLQQDECCGSGCRYCIYDEDPVTDDSCLYCENDVLAVLCDQHFGDGYSQYQVKWCASCGTIREKKVDDYGETVEWKRPSGSGKRRATNDVL